MKVFVFFLCVSVVFSCKTKKDYTPAENALDAGREFIDAGLKGDFGKANFYLLPDTTNTRMLKEMEDRYRTKDKEGRQQLRQASITIQEIIEKNDSLTLMNYQNTFDTIPLQLKVIRRQQSWMVDLKHSYLPKP